MKLSNEQVDFISRAVNVANLVGITSMIIGNGYVRAIDENMTVLMIEEDGIPDFEFEALGLSNVPSLISRLNILADKDNFKMEATIDNNSQAVRMLTMKAGRTKMDYQCALPSIIQAPKRINDNFVTQVQGDTESVAIIQKGLSAMNGELITLLSNDSGVSAEISAINNDIFNHTLTNDAEAINGSGETRFIFKYPAKTLLSIMKKNPEGHFCIGENGTISMVVDGFHLFMLQQK